MSTYRNGAGGLDRPKERGTRGIELELGPLRPDPEPEALVDGRLRCPEDRDRLASLARLGDQPGHHLAQDPAPGVRRQDSRSS